MTPLSGIPTPVGDAKDSGGGAGKPFLLALQHCCIACVLSLAVVPRDTHVPAAPSRRRRAAPGSSCRCCSSLGRFQALSGGWQQVRVLATRARGARRVRAWPPCPFVPGGGAQARGGDRVASPARRRFSLQARWRQRRRGATWRPRRPRGPSCRATWRSSWMGTRAGRVRGGWLCLRATRRASAR